MNFHGPDDFARDLDCWEASTGHDILDLTREEAFDEIMCLPIRDGAVPLALVARPAHNLVAVGAGANKVAFGPRWKAFLSEICFVLSMVIVSWPPLASASSQASLSKAWIGCDDVNDAARYARARAGGDEGAARAKEERLTAGRADGHPACQSLIPGSRVSVVRAAAEMRCIEEFHSYGTGCLWLPASALREQPPAAKRKK